MDITVYQYISVLPTYLLPHFNMSDYYDFCKLKFPSIEDKLLKDILLEALYDYSKSNQLLIDNIHPFSEQIINYIQDNLILNISSVEKHNKLLRLKENMKTNYKITNEQKNR